MYVPPEYFSKQKQIIPWINLKLGTIALVFERMDMFVHGSTVQVFSDHKPLTAITKKEIGELSIRQQRMTAHLMQYNFEVNYAPSKLMDGRVALSRAP
jgi:hypothetical protein